MPSKHSITAVGRPRRVDWREADLIRDAIEEIWETMDTHATLEEAWPIGSAFFTEDDTNPASLLGMGTWEANTPPTVGGLKVWTRTA